MPNYSKKRQYYLSNCSSVTSVKGSIELRPALLTRRSTGKTFFRVSAVAFQLERSTAWISAVGISFFKDSRAVKERSRAMIVAPHWDSFREIPRPIPFVKLIRQEIRKIESHLEQLQ